MKLLSLAIAALLVSQTPKASTGKVVASDGFESPTLSKQWGTWRFVPGDVQMETNIVRAGRQAVQLTVHSGDLHEPAANQDADSERTELVEARNLTSHENVPYQFSFSMYFPANFPVVPVRLVVAQWKQACINANGVFQAGGPCYDDSPVLALRYVNGELQITQDLRHRSFVLYRKKAEFRRQWLDFRFRVRFTAAPDGQIKAWINKRQVVDFKGATANPDNPKTGYPTPSFFYFKMGLYRNTMNEPMTVYIDEYQKLQLPTLKQ